MERTSGDVETAATREEVVAIQRDLESQWDQVREKWQELLIAYPEPEVIRDDAGEEIVDDEARILEIRGKYSIRTTYMDAAEDAQYIMQTAIRHRYAEFDTAGRASRGQAEQDRVRAFDLANENTYESSLELWTDIRGRLHPLIHKLKMSVDVAEVSSNLAKAKKFDRWVEEIAEMRAAMNRMSLEMIKAVPARAEQARARQIEEKALIEAEFRGYSAKVQNYHDACLERRDELDDAASSTARASTPDLEARSEFGGVRVQNGGLSLEKLKCEGI